LCERALRLILTHAYFLFLHQLFISIQNPDNQYEIVKGILRGDWDVGFVRTGQIERTKDDDGNPLDAELFKILNPNIYVLDDGTLFPFMHSTPVFPEWPVSASNHVAGDVIEEVQDALIKLRDHLHIGELMSQCAEDICKVEVCEEGEVPEVCKTAPPSFFDPGARCDTTRELALLAFEAGRAAGIDGFRPPRSHFHLRTMQQAAGFLTQNAKGKSKGIIGLMTRVFLLLCSVSLFTNLAASSNAFCLDC